MSGQPAARVGDPHACPAVTVLVPHIGGPILAPGAPTVLIGGQPAARMGDQAFCVGPPDVIAQGAFPVAISSQPASRQGDMTAHGGSIVIGFATVLIGLSGTAGNPRVGTSACAAAAGGRNSGTRKQSYGNCGVESSRQLINQVNQGKGPPLTENQLMGQAIEAKKAEGAKYGPWSRTDGGTTSEERQAILASHGVASTVQESNAANLGQAMTGGRGVIANLDAADLWAGQPGAPPPGAGHAVLVTGVEYDDAGKPVNVIINDTGKGTCGEKIPIDKWNKAVSNWPNAELNVTSAPVW